MKNTVRLTESALMLAASFVLSLIPIINMPFGGSVTAASMLPVLLIAYRHGTKWGIFTAFAASLIQLLMGLNNLSYATSAAAAVAIILLDYVVAFAAMGLGGVFRKIAPSQTAGVLSGVVLCCVIRYICHVISGCTVWAGVSIPDALGLQYSLAYNAAYMVPETIITVAAAAALSMSLDLTSPQPRPARHVKGRPLAFVSILVTIVSATVGAVLLFQAIQTEEGFDIAAATGGDILTVGICGVIAVIGMAVAACSVRSKT